MAKSVLFKNRSGQKFYVEVGHKDNLTDKAPKVFDNDFDGHAKLVLFDAYGMIYPNGEEKPVSYFRHTDLAKNRYRFGNILELGDGPLSVQKGPRCPGKLAGTDTPVSEYRLVSENPPVYGFDSQEPLVEYRLDADCMTVKESDCFSLKAEPWPITIYDHQSIYVDSSLISQPATFSGVLNGKPFVGLGNYDRYCMKENAGSFSNVPMGYTAICMKGIREDGRKELVFASGSCNEDGKTVAIYYIDGETPIVSEYFEFEADWYHLPYVDDGTCVFRDAIIRFCGKEFHFTGKWGTKGFTDKPRVEKHGQSQVVGVWYEGSVPYTHRLSECWAENMEAYDYKLKERGFDVLD